MSARAARKAARVLAQRREAFDSLRQMQRQGRKRPGSLNPKRSQARGNSKRRRR